MVIGEPSSMSEQTLVGITFEQRSHLPSGRLQHSGYCPSIPPLHPGACPERFRYGHPGPRFKAVGSPYYIYLTVFSRMHRRMGTLPPSIITKKSEWEFYTPYTVRMGSSSLLSISFTPNRSRSVLRTVGLDPVLYHEALVLSLPQFAVHCDHQRGSGNSGISFQNTRTWAPPFT